MTPPPVSLPTMATAENNRFSFPAQLDTQSKSSNFCLTKTAHIVEMMIAFGHILCYSKGCEMGVAEGCRRFLKTEIHLEMKHIWR